MDVELTLSETWERQVTVGVDEDDVRDRLGIPCGPISPAEVERFLDLDLDVGAGEDWFCRLPLLDPKHYGVDFNGVDVLHVSPVPDGGAPAIITDHAFRPVAGHPDDDECTHRADGTDATYCGAPSAAHAESEA